MRKYLYRRLESVTENLVLHDHRRIIAEAGFLVYLLLVFILMLSGYAVYHMFRRYWICQLTRHDNESMLLKDINIFTS